MASEESQPADDMAKDYADHGIFDIHKCPNLAKFDRQVKYVSSWF